jgi:hypothetical protein
VIQVREVILAEVKMTQQTGFPPELDRNQRNRGEHGAVPPDPLDSF